MACSIDSIEGIAACLKLAIDWFDVAKAALSLVSAGAVSALLFVIGAWKRDKSRSEQDIKSLAELTQGKDEEIKFLTEELQKYEGIALNISFQDTVLNTIGTWHHPRFKKDADRHQIEQAKSNAGVPTDTGFYSYFDLSTFWTPAYLVIAVDGIYWPGQTRLPWDKFAEVSIIAASDELRIGLGPAILTNGKIPPELVTQMMQTLQSAVRPYFEYAGDTPEVERAAAN